MNDAFILEILRDMLEIISDESGNMYPRIDGKLDALEDAIKNPPPVSRTSEPRY